MNRITIINALIVFLIALPAIGSEVVKVHWNDLVPEEPLNEVVTSLPEREKASVEWIIHLRGSLPDVYEPKYEDLYREVNEALPRLSAQGIDVDEIVEARKRNKTATNPHLERQRIILAGYMLPLEFSGRKVTEFLLVPYVGACIHAPPPPPNQIVYVKVSDHNAYELKEIYDPVQVTGEISTQATVKDLFLVDGSAGISIGYVMDARRIDPYKG